jgi:ATP-binding cassette, subfamily B, bacterial
MSSKDAKTKKKISVTKLFFRLLPLSFRAAPGVFIAMNAASLVQGTTQGFMVLFTQHFYDNAAALAGGDGTVSAVLTALIILASMNIFREILNVVYNFLPSIFAKIGMRNTSIMIQKKLEKIDPKNFESTEFLDSINKAKQGRSFAFQFIFKILVVFTYYLPYYITMGFYLFSVKPLFVILIIIVFIPPALTQIIRTKVYSQLEDRSAPVRREYDYYEKSITSSEYFKETRILGSYKYLIGLFGASLKLLNKIMLKTEIKISILELSMNLIGMAGYLGILFLLFTSLMKQEITIGMFAAVYASIGGMFGSMGEMIHMHLAGVSNNLGAVNNIMEFIDLPERKGEDNIVDRDADITVDNISFTYTGSDQYALKDVSFTIKAHETIAIVGENGSGKSTLIKLLTGLYLPDEGSIHIGNADTGKLTMKSLFKNVSAVFQQYQKYKLLLKENISISNTEEEASDERLDIACGMAGFDKDDSMFDSGYDTMLSREFDGVDLSGGQWQKVAISRGFYRNYDMIILDEPTAAIDPIEETKVYDRFAALSKGKTSFIVTHRLGSVKLADRIMVLSKGKLAEMGTHDELMENNAEYARMYKAQQQWYV